jgi:DNA polymerase III delta subunit
VSPKKAREATPRPAKKPAAKTKVGASSILSYYNFVDAQPDPLPRIIVLTGPQPMLASNIYARIIASVLPDESSRALNLDEIDASDDAAVQAIPGKAAALPFLSERRAVSVRGAVDLKTDDRAALRSVLEGVPEHALVIVDHAGIPQRAQGRRLADEAASLAGAADDGIVVECTLDGRASGRFVDEAGAHAQVKIDPAARSLLAGSQDAAEITNVVERLALTAVKGRITAEAVKSSIQPYDDIRLWNFAAAVHAGDTDAALRLVREVMDKPENIAGPLFVLAADSIVIWELKRSTSNEYAEAAGLSPYRVSALQSAARTVTLEVAAKAVNLTKRALEYMYTGHGDPSVMLDELIVRLCSLRRGRDRAPREAIA